MQERSLTSLSAPSRRVASTVKGNPLRIYDLRSRSAKHRVAEFHPRPRRHTSNIPTPGLLQRRADRGNEESTANFTLRRVDV